MQEKCYNHPERKALSICHSCGRYFCSECLIEGREYYYCLDTKCQEALKNEQINHTGDIDEYVDKLVGLSRRKLNIRAIIGIFIFGILMFQNYIDLKEKRTGWIFMTAMAFVYAIAQQIEPIVGFLAPVIYVAAWIHTNYLLSIKQINAKEQYLKEKTSFVEKLFDEGIKFYEKGKYIEAEKKFNEALKILPNSEDILYNLALIYLAQKKYNLVTDIISKINEIDCSEIVNELKKLGVTNK